MAAAHPELPVDNDNSAHLMKAIGRLDLREQLAAIACPVLVLYGSRDAVMVAGGRMLAARLPSSQSCVLPDVGHEPFIEAPTEAFTTLRRFLTEQAR